MIYVHTKREQAKEETDMKYTVKAIENAKPGMKWEDIGCHWTLGQAYLYHNVPEYTRLYRRVVNGTPS